MLLYHYDRESALEMRGTVTEALKCPKTDVFLVPNAATPIEPPVPMPEEVNIFDEFGQEWVTVPANLI